MESANQIVNLGDKVVFETPDAFSENTKSTRKETSNVWKFFTKAGKDKDGIERAACNYCERDYVIGKNPKTKTNYGTSHLSRHISVCKGILNSNLNVDDVLSNQKHSTRRINQKTHCDLLAQAIIQHDLPFNFVEDDNIREWVNYLNPNIVMPSKKTILSDIQEIYIREKEKLKQVMSKIPNRVCLTSDVWTISTTEGYICLTAHFVDENWKLVSKIHNFCRMEPSHTGSQIEAVFFDCLKHWGIDKKVFSITLDNVFSNDSMHTLKAHLCLENSLLCDGDFFYVRCSAYILNLVVQEGLKVVDETLHKIRESVKYVRASEDVMIRFKDCVQQAGIDTIVSLILDVSTRWDSTYLMLESAIKYEKAFDILRMTDTNYLYCPSNEEWRMGEQMCEFLEPFYEITNMISSSSYSTSNLYYLQVWKIECMLDENLLHDDDIIREMSARMKIKFDKYWKEYSVVLAFGAILDPRMKLDFVLFCYAKLDLSTSKGKVKNVREKFEKLYGEYVSNFNAPNASQSQPVSESSMLHKSSGEGSRPKRSKVFEEFKMFLNETKSNIGKSELDLYLEEKALNYDDNEDLDVLNYWKTGEKRFPTLAIMARDVLSIPITTVASESAFSIGGRVLSKYKSSTLPENVQMLICTRNWLHGFVLNHNDEDDHKPICHGL